MPTPRSLRLLVLCRPFYAVFNGMICCTRTEMEKRKNCRIAGDRWMWVSSVEEC